MFFPLEFIVLDFQALKKPKMGMSLRDVTVTLKRQEKIRNIFFSQTEYISLQENICLTLLPKNSHGITQRPTLILNASIVNNCFNI